MTNGEKPELNGHSHLVRAAEATVAIAAIIGVGQFLNRRQHHTRTHTFDKNAEGNLDHYKERAGMFNDLKLDLYLREDMAKAGILIHHATFNAVETFISDDHLQAKLGVEPSRYKMILHRLQDKRFDEHRLALIERSRDPENHHTKGWSATPVLTWAIEAGDYGLLQQAQSDLLTANASVGTYVHEEKAE